MAHAAPLYDADYLTYNALPSALWIAAGDVDGDGRPDLVVTGAPTSWLRGRGDGTFEGRVELGLPYGAPAIGDLDNDGRADVVAGGSVRLSQGGGLFGPPIPFGGSSSAVALGDMNGDGKLDIVNIQSGQTGVSVYRGNGDGTFQQISAQAIQRLSNDVAVGDLDGDGDLDVAVPHGRSLNEHPCWSELFNDGTGAIGPPQGYGTCGITPRSTVTIGDRDDDGDNEVALDILAIADVNGDGREDVLSGFATTSLQVELAGGGGGTFPVGPKSSRAALADFDGDGAMDVAVATSGCTPGAQPYECPYDAYPTTFSVLLGRGDGTFGGRGRHLGTLLFPRSSAIGDLDGDGKNDLVTGASTGGTQVSFGDGLGGFAAPVTYGVHTSGGVGLRDLDGDGRLDLIGSTGGGLVTMRNLGSGALGDIRSYSGAGALGFELAQIDGDGILDVVGASSSAVTVWFGVGDGTFGPATSLGSLPSTLDSWAVGDLDGDGDGDIIASLFFMGFQGWRNNGNRTFTNVSTNLPFSLNADVMKLVDLDHDGVDELVFSRKFIADGSPQADPNYGKVDVRRRTGAFQFGSAVFFETAGQTNALLFADLDRNGDIDLIATDDVSRDVSVLMGNGDGTFQAKQGFGANGNAPKGVSAGDLNGDQLPDLAITYATPGPVTLLLSRSTDPTPTLLVLYDAQETAEGIEVRWQFADHASIERVVLEAAESADGPWQAVAAETHLEGGVTVALDRVAEGASRWYRLVVTDRDGMRTAFEPIHARRLGGIARASLTAMPNPSAGPIRLQYTLARAGSARLSVVDLLGRTVVVLVEGVQSAGPHVAVWEDRQARQGLRAGVYFARLETKDARITRRFVIAR